eukprot:SAG31_NODE_1233_length_9206_cov_32.480290_3_plen_2308_part_00
MGLFLLNLPYTHREIDLSFLVFMGLIEKYGTNRESATLQGLLSFEEVRLLAEATGGVKMAWEEYLLVAQAAGFDADAGLKPASLRKIYFELEAGDPESDFYAMRAFVEQRHAATMVQSMVRGLMARKNVGNAEWRAAIEQPLACDIVWTPYSQMRLRAYVDEMKRTQGTRVHWGEVGTRFGCAAAVSKTEYERLASTVNPSVDVAQIRPGDSESLTHRPSISSIGQHLQSPRKLNNIPPKEDRSHDDVSRLGIIQATERGLPPGTIAPTVHAVTCQRNGAIRVWAVALGKAEVDESIKTNVRDPYLLNQLHHARVLVLNGGTRATLAEMIFENSEETPTQLALMNDLLAVSVEHHQNSGCACQIRVWDFKRSMHLVTLTPQESSISDSICTGLEFHSDKMLAAWFPDAFCLWDLANVSDHVERTVSSATSTSETDVGAPRLKAVLDGVSNSQVALSPRFDSCVAVTESEVALWNFGPLQTTSSEHVSTPEWAFMKVGVLDVEDPVIMSWCPQENADVFAVLTRSSIMLWNEKKNEMQWKIHLDGDALERSLVWSESGQYLTILTAMDMQRMVQMWKVTESQHTAVFETAQLLTAVPTPHEQLHLHVLEDEDKIALVHVNDRSTLAFQEVETNVLSSSRNRWRELNLGLENVVSCSTLSACGTVCALGLRDGRIQIWTHRKAGSAREHELSDDLNARSACTIENPLPVHNLESAMKDISGEETTAGSSLMSWQHLSEMQMYDGSDTQQSQERQKASGISLPPTVDKLVISRDKTKLFAASRNANLVRVWKFHDSAFAVAPAVATESLEFATIDGLKFTSAHHKIDIDSNGKTVTKKDSRFAYEKAAICGDHVMLDGCLNYITWTLVAESGSWAVESKIHVGVMSPAADLSLDSSGNGWKGKQNLAKALGGVAVGETIQMCLDLRKEKGNGTLTIMKNGSTEEIATKLTGPLCWAASCWYAGDSVEFSDATEALKFAGDSVEFSEAISKPKQSPSLRKVASLITSFDKESFGSNNAWEVATDEDVIMMAVFDGHFKLGAATENEWSLGPANSLDYQSNMTRGTPTTAPTCLAVSILQQHTYMLAGYASGIVEVWNDTAELLGQVHSDMGCLTQLDVQHGSCIATGTNGCCVFDVLSREKEEVYPNVQALCLSRTKSNAAKLEPCVATDTLELSLCFLKSQEPLIGMPLFLDSEGLIGSISFADNGVLMMCISNSRIVFFDSGDEHTSLNKIPTVTDMVKRLLCSSSADAIRTILEDPQKDEILRSKCGCVTTWAPGMGPVKTWADASVPGTVISFPNSGGVEDSYVLERGDTLLHCLFRLKTVGSAIDSTGSKSIAKLFETFFDAMDPIQLCPNASEQDVLEISIIQNDMATVNWLLERIGKAFAAVNDAAAAVADHGAKESATKLKLFREKASNVAHVAPNLRRDLVLLLRQEHGRNMELVTNFLETFGLVTLPHGVGAYHDCTSMSLAPDALIVAVSDTKTFVEVLKPAKGWSDGFVPVPKTNIFSQFSVVGTRDQDQGLDQELEQFDSGALNRPKSFWKKQIDARQLEDDGSMKRSTMAAVVPIANAMEPDEYDLLRAIKEATRDPKVFEIHALRAIIDARWRTYAQPHFMREAQISVAFCALWAFFVGCLTRFHYLLGSTGVAPQSLSEPVANCSCETLDGWLTVQTTADACDDVEGLIYNVSSYFAVVLAVGLMVVTLKYLSQISDTRYFFGLLAAACQLILQSFICQAFHWAYLDQSSSQELAFWITMIVVSSITAFCLLGVWYWDGKDETTDSEKDKTTELKKNAALTVFVCVVGLVWAVPLVAGSIGLIYGSALMEGVCNNGEIDSARTPSSSSESGSSNGVSNTGEHAVDNAGFHSGCNEGQFYLETLASTVGITIAGSYFINAVKPEFSGLDFSDFVFFFRLAFIPFLFIEVGFIASCWIQDEAKLPIFQAASAWWGFGTEMVLLTVLWLVSRSDSLAILWISAICVLLGCFTYSIASDAIVALVPWLGFAAQHHPEWPLYFSIIPLALMTLRHLRLEITHILQIGREAETQKHTDIPKHSVKASWASHLGRFVCILRWLWRGIPKHLKDPWNKIDFLLDTTIVAVIIMALTGSHAKQVHAVAAATTILLAARSLNLLSGWTSTAYLLRVIWQVLVDMRAFALVVAIFAIANALAFQLLFATHPDDAWSDDEAAEIHLAFGNEYRSLLSSVDMAFTIGGQWAQGLHDRAAYPYFTWPLAVTYMLVQSVVLLNLLIAIMSDSCECQSNYPMWEDMFALCDCKTQSRCFTFVPPQMRRSKIRLKLKAASSWSIPCSNLSAR